MNGFIDNELEYKKQFTVSDDDYGYFPASLDGKEGFDIRIRGVQWPDSSGNLDGILDNKMPTERLPEFESTIREYINKVAQLGKILLLAIGRENNFGNAFHEIMPGTSLEITIQCSICIEILYIITYYTVLYIDKYCESKKDIEVFYVSIIIQQERQLGLLGKKIRLH